MKETEFTSNFFKAEAEQSYNSKGGQSHDEVCSVDVLDGLKHELVGRSSGLEQTYLYQFVVSLRGL